MKMSQLIVWRVILNNSPRRLDDKLKVNRLFLAIRMVSPHRHVWTKHIGALNFWANKVLSTRFMAALLKSPTFYLSGGVSRCRNVDVCVLAINFSLGTVNCTSHHQEVPTWHNWFVVNACLCQWVCKITVLALSQEEALFKDLQLFQTGSWKHTHTTHKTSSRVHIFHCSYS